MMARFIGKLNQTFQKKPTDLSYVIDKRYHIEHTWSRTRIELTILSLSRTDCICYCKINYHMLVVAKIHKYSNNHTEQRTTERQENAHVNRGEWDKTLQKVWRRIWGQTTQWPKDKGQKNNTHNDLQNNTHKTKDRVTRTSLNTEGELMCSGRVISSCSTSDTYVLLIH